MAKLSPEVLQRLASIEQIEVQHDDFTSVRDEIATCVEVSKRRKRPLCATLTGPAGSGKSTLCRSLVSEYQCAPHTRTGFHTNRVGAFYEELSSPVNVYSLTSAMLTGLGDPMPTVGRIDGRTSRIVKQAQTCEMELAILDEFHHLFAAEDPSVSLNWLKSLVSKLQSPLVIAGISTIRDLINSDTQLSRRFEVRLEMRYLPLTSASESDFRSFLTAFAEGVRTKLHLAEMPDVTHPPTMMSIYALTRACPSAVATFFFHSGKKAAEKGSAERMLLDDFVNAAREPFFDSFRVTTKNPFVMDPPAVFSELRAARLI